MINPQTIKTTSIIIGLLGQQKFSKKHTDILKRLIRRQVA